MKNIRIFRNVALAIIAALAVIACQKQPLNPPVENLPAKDFEYTVTEHRELKTFIWKPKSNTGPLSNGEESIELLYVTSYNDVTIDVTGAAVNVSSSRPECVYVERIGTSGKTFKLTYKGEGVATIKLWNGPEGTGEVKKTFEVGAKEYIDVEGVWFTYGGERLEIRHFTLSRPPLLCRFPEDETNESKSRPGATDFSLIPYAKPMIWQDGPGETAAERHNNGDFVTNPDQGTLLTFGGLIPENTSFRTIESFESEWETHPARNFLKYMIRKKVVEEGEYNGQWPNIQDNPKDVSEYSEAKMWIAICNFNFYMASIKITAQKAKYFYLYHAIEDYDD